MRHEMSLRGGIFNDAVDLFDTKLRDVLNTLLRQGLSEGSVTLKVNVELWNVGEQDENGIYHETNKTHFDYNVTSAITQKNKSNGEVKEMLKLRCVDGSSSCAIWTRTRCLILWRVVFRMERSPTETAHLVDSHYSRSFGRPPDNEMREFIRNAAEHGLTADELINCMTAAVVTYGFGAYERDYRKAFVAEARKIWKMKNGKKKASP